MKYHANNNQSSIIDNQLVRRSTSVENVRQIRLFLQNKPNYPHFSPENDDLTQKQTQYKPKQSQLLQRLKMNVFARKMSFTIVYCDFIANFITLKGANIKGGKAKTKPIKPNNQSSLIHNQLEGKLNVKIGKILCFLSKTFHPNKG